MGVMAVLKHQFAIEINVEFTMSGWDQMALTDQVTILVENLPRYPSGSESLSSGMAILNGNF